MHIIAITSSFTATIDVLFAFSIHEVSDWRKDGTNFFAIEESTIDMIECIFRVLFIAVFDIDVADDVISEVINDYHILNLTILAHLIEDLSIKILIPK